jgi:hypothetical protein
MSVSVELVQGPPVSTPRATAEEGLRRHAAIAAGAPYALEQVNGQWVAAIVHTADFPGGPPEESGPPPQSAGPDDAGAGLPPEGDGDGDEGADPTAPSDGDGDESSGGDKSKKKDKGGKGAQLKQILDALTQIGQALGIPLDPTGGDPNDPTGGLGDPSGGLGDGGAVPPPGPGVPGAGGPPPGPGGPGGAAAAHGADQAIMHMKALKPGETPPGATPAGASAFSSVRPDHPWINAIDKVASFHTSSPIGNASLVDVQNELQALASEVGYRVANFGEGVDEHGQRIATAVITAH